MSNNRKYNIFFHLHTVSGISITIGLFVIFFAGSFTLFREEIKEWESATAEGKEKVEPEKKRETDYCLILQKMEQKVPHIYGRKIYGRISALNGKHSFYISETADTSAGKAGQESFRFGYNDSKKQLISQSESFSLGELLYLLHFYYQLDRIGYYISGFVALFFFFAIITGVIVHWKKVFSNFFVFRPKQKMKTIWTDAHTALGFIGLPFQFVYALTGSMFGLGILVALTNGLWVYQGDADKMYRDLDIRKTETSLGKKSDKTVHLNELMARTEKKWSHFKSTGFYIQHYGSDSMTVQINGEQHISEQFLGEAQVTYDINGKEIDVQNPGEVSYYNGVWGSVRRLHYAQFGNIGSIGSYMLKLVYFLMALLTCFVIITGVLIWLEARNKKNLPDKKKRYNKRVGVIYMAICLSLIPVTAGSFILSKLIPASMEASREAIINYGFFLGWLGVTILFIFLRSNYITNKYSLLIGGILGLAIPLVNGIVSGTWFWTNYAYGEYGVFSIDLIWLVIGLLSLLVVFKLKKKTEVAEVK